MKQAENALKFFFLMNGLLVDRRAGDGDKF